MKSITTIAVFGALLMGNLASAAFSKVCSGVTVIGGGDWPVELTATCTIRGKGGQKSKLNLSDCYGYQSGAIVYQNNGNVQSSCRSCSNNVMIMKCSCKDDNGNYSDRSHDLDSGTEIQNNNGFLKCFGHTADPDKKVKIFVS